MEAHTIRTLQKWAQYIVLSCSCALLSTWQTKCAPRGISVRTCGLFGMHEPGYMHGEPFSADADDADADADADADDDADAPWPMTCRAFHSLLPLGGWPPTRQWVQASIGIVSRLFSVR